MKSEEITGDVATVLNAGYRILKVCDGAQSKDKRGFNKPDAVLIRELYFKPAEELTMENVEFIRRKLLNYEIQLTKFGIDYPKLRDMRIAERAVFFKRPLSDAEIRKVVLKIRGEGLKIEIVAHHFSDRRKSKYKIEMDREEGIEFLNKHLTQTVIPYESLYYLKIELVKDGATKFLKKSGLIESDCVEVTS